MKRAILFAVVLCVMTSLALAEPICPNQGFQCECQNFYNDMNYYSVAKAAMADEGYVIEENFPYRFFDIEVTGDMQDASWTSNLEIYSVLVKAGDERVEFLADGLEGDVYSEQDISHMTFCAYSSNSGGNGGNGGNGVPEYSTFALGAAVLAAAAGLIFLRKR